MNMALNKSFDVSVYTRTEYPPVELHTIQINRDGSGMKTGRPFRACAPEAHHHLR